MNKADLIRVQTLEQEIAGLTHELATATDQLATLDGSPAFRTINLYLRKLLAQAEAAAMGALKTDDFERGDKQGQITALRSACQIHVGLATSIDRLTAEIRERQSKIQKLRQQP